MRECIESELGPGREGSEMGGDGFSTIRDAEGDSPLLPEVGKGKLEASPEEVGKGKLEASPEEVGKGKLEASPEEVGKGKLEAGAGRGGSFSSDKPEVMAFKTASELLERVRRVRGSEDAPRTGEGGRPARRAERREVS